MTLQRLGQIFDPRAHRLLTGCVDFAQSPQTLMRDNGLRVYFSTRSAETDGTFRSHPAYVDFDMDLRTIRGVSSHQILPLGALGTFDEHGIFPLSVLRSGSEIRGYTTGWNRRVSVSVDTGIGLVVSYDDGETFSRIGDGPILGPSLHEPMLVCDGFVLEAFQRFHMFYIFGQRWVRETAELPPDRVYKIGHTTSVDGVFWEPSGGKTILPDQIGLDECQALPSVAWYGGRYHMAFCYRDAHGFRHDRARAYRLGYAWSDDLENWTRDDDVLAMAPQAGAWDSEMQCYPHLFVHQGVLHMLYNGNAFGRYGFGLARLDL
ncbi:hypothetical protein ABWH93_18250 [Seohaeicola saemankumensis]|uniref:hypothetical protein n=1 Tax=Seohaeicola saemankumensis TaxID=481181 RepID=UPI0035D00F70